MCGEMTESWKWDYGLLDPISSISKWEYSDVKNGETCPSLHVYRGFLIPISVLILVLSKPPTPCL